MPRHQIVFLIITLSNSLRFLNICIPVNCCSNLNQNVILGRRSCIGEQISRVEIFLCFADLLHNFTFCWPDEYPTPSLDYKTFGGLTGMVMCAPEEDVHMTAVPRQ